MWAPIIFSTLIISCHAVPLPETNNLETTAEQPELNLINYVTHFRKIISQYITAQYQTTHEDLDKISAILDDFFNKLAADLNDVIKKDGYDWPKRTVNDNIPDEKFDEIKVTIRQQLPNIKEGAVDEMICRLRENLLDTKNKLDRLLNGNHARVLVDVTKESYEASDY